MMPFKFGRDKPSALGIMTSQSGEIEEKNMDILSTAGAFEQFGPAHLSVIGITLFLCVFLPVLVRKRKSQRLAKGICWILAGILVVSEAGRAVYFLTREGWDVFVAEGLPLHACGMAIYITAIMLLTKQQLLYEIAYFWGMAGTVQALLTPVVEVGFPSWRFVLFFLGHCSIIVSVVFATFGLGLRPRWKGLWITYSLSWCVAGLIGLVNIPLGTNYMYLREPPAGKSPFYFLPWPWYIPFLGVVALVLFVLLWLPFCRSGKQT